jgi:hypothetical protein
MFEKCEIETSRASRDKSVCRSFDPRTGWRALSTHYYEIRAPEDTEVAHKKQGTPVLEGKPFGNFPKRLTRAEPHGV